VVKAISDVRVARSFIGAGASAQETVELDFNLSTREAIRIYGIIGNILVASGIGASVEPVGLLWDQSLHLEEGTITVPNTAGIAADQFENDDEIIYHQYCHIQAMSSSGIGGLAMQVTPSGMVRFPEPILSVVNPTHREQSDEEEAGFELLIYYDYVELSDNEMALAFARRRR